MKNKHLLLLFIATIAVGLLARRVPWFRAKIFQTDLIALDTASVTQISIFQPNQPELLIERTEGGWAAAQEMRSVAVAPEYIAPLLAELSGIRSLRIVETAAPDSLGFSEKNRLQIVVLQDGETPEQFEIGFETLENGQKATYIRLNRHEGVYLVQNHLRGIFSKKLDDFRDKRVSGFDPAAVNSVVVEWRKDGEDMRYPIYQNDTTLQWISPGGAPAANDTVQRWLRLFNLLNGSPFADHFDESRAPETLVSRITLYLASSDSLVFRVFHVKPPDFPEELPLSKARELPVYVLHSSQNPANFFAPPDTVLLRRICMSLIPMEPAVRAIPGK